MNAINRVFLVAMVVAVAYWCGELLVRTFALPVSVLRIGSAVIPFIFAPALPIRLLFPRLSFTAYLIVACLGWGVLVQVCVATLRRLRAKTP